MIHHIFYQVQPTSVLTEWLEQHEAHSDVMNLIAVPQLWVHTVKGQSALDGTDIDLQAKLLYLANLNHLYIRENDAALDVQTILIELLGAAPWTSAVFDRWWTLHRYELEESSEAVIDDLAHQDLAVLAKTGQPGVDAWLDTLIERKKAEAAS